MNLAVRLALSLLAFPLLTACASKAPGRITLRPAAAVPPDQHIPDYARRPFEPFGRSNATSIARREWRAFGSIVNDDPAARPRGGRPDLLPGLWQRVGDYWWFGMDAATKEGAWTSRYNEYGSQYNNDSPAWSAAFISYVMRAAGAGTSFPYSPLHADYINAAARNEGALRAERPGAYPPQPGDIICVGRGEARALTYEDLPATRFFAHCDLVVSANPGQLEVIGGNVAAGVTLRHIPTTPDGRLEDPRFNWFVILRVQYDAP